MAIIRVIKNKKNPYVIINKTGINDPRLSLKAKGLLAYLLSKPDDWFVNYHDIVKHSLNGIESVRSAVKELLSFGYIVRSQIRSDDGRFGYFDYIVYEKPQNLNFIKNKLPPHRRKPDAVKPYKVNHTLLSNDKTYIMKKITTTRSIDSKPLSLAAVDFLSLKKRNDTILLLNKLNIRNIKKIFKEFHPDKVFDYTTWIINKKSKMLNPTGYLITAMRENWIDYEPKDSQRRTVLHYAKCPSCGYSCGYEHYPGTTINCRECKKPIPKELYEKI